MDVLLTALLVFVCAPAYADDDSDCPLPDLLSGFPSENSTTPTTLFSMCDPTEEPEGICTVSFEGGSVTYNGNSSGSIAFYNVSAAYCLNDTRSRECQAGMWINNVILEKVATQSFLQGWNIALIVIGVVAFVVGDGIAAGLGTWLAVKAVKFTDKAIAIAMIVVSVVIVLPVAGPVALIMYIALKKLGHDDKTIQMKWWYRMLTVFAILLKLLGVAVWLVQAGYSATQDFYGEGPLRDKNGTCVPHEPNTEQKRVQDALVIISHVISLVVMVDLHVKAILSKLGTKKAKESTDLGSKREKAKDKEKEGHELNEYPVAPVDDTPSSPTPLVT